MVVVTAGYKAGVSFNEEYYRQNHMALVDRVLKPLGMDHQEIIKVMGMVDGSAAPYQLLANLYFDSLESFQAALQHPDTQQVFADIPNYYQGQPDLLLGQVVNP